MRTPATLWHPSRGATIRIRRVGRTPQGSWVLKVDCKGKIEIKGQKWRVGKALSGEWVQIVRVEQRMMVFYCTTLIQELDPGTQRSTIVERWVPHTAPAAKV